MVDKRCWRLRTDGLVVVIVVRWTNAAAVDRSSSQETFMTINKKFIRYITGDSLGRGKDVGCEIDYVDWISLLIALLCL